jgi:hypothetical protein
MIPTEIIPVIELTYTELDAVSGGILNAFNIINQQNFATTVGVAAAVAGVASSATVAQVVGQSNVSF